jgi:hypothetical protein
MEIEMKVLGEQESLNPAQLQRIRRTINVLCNDGFDVNLSFKNSKTHGNNDQTALSHIDGRYERKYHYM